MPSEARTGTPPARGGPGWLGTAGTLAAANAVALGVWLAHGLDLLQLAAIFWIEALWLGLFGVLKLLAAGAIGRPFETRRVGVSRGASILTALVLVGFFGLKYVGFIAGLGIGLAAAASTAGVDLPGMLAADGRALAIAGGVLLTGHAFAFVFLFVLGGGVRAARGVGLAFSPWLHAVGIVAGMAGSAWLFIGASTAGSGTVAGAIIVAAKLAWDVVLVGLERGRLDRAAASRLALQTV
jgi:hypothetical protein